RGVVRSLRWLLLALVVACAVPALPSGRGEPPPQSAPTPAALVAFGEAAAEAFSGPAAPPASEKHQDLLDEIAPLQKQLRAAPTAPVSTCHLKGKVEGNHATLTATFEFVTQQPNTLIYLGCGQAQPSDVKLDGHTPLFQKGEKGFSVQAEQPGEHKLVL